MTALGARVTIRPGWGYTLTDGFRFHRSGAAGPAARGVVYAVDRGRVYLTLDTGQNAYTVPNALEEEAPA